MTIYRFHPLMGCFEAVAEGFVTADYETWTSSAGIDFTKSR
jgi:hypothetical protein